MVPIKPNFIVCIIRKLMEKEFHSNIHQIYFFLGIFLDFGERICAPECAYAHPTRLLSIKMQENLDLAELMTC